MREFLWRLPEAFSPFGEASGAHAEDRWCTRVDSGVDQNAGAGAGRADPKSFERSIVGELDLVQEVVHDRR